MGEWKEFDEGYHRREVDGVVFAKGGDRNIIRGTCLKRARSKLVSTLNPNETQATFRRAETSEIGTFWERGPKILKVLKMSHAVE
jgi:hypothetical protein